MATTDADEELELYKEAKKKKKKRKIHCCL